MQPITERKTTPSFNLMGSSDFALGNINRTTKADSNAFWLMGSDQLGEFFCDTFLDVRGVGIGFHAEPASINDIALIISSYDLLFGATNLDTDARHGVFSLIKVLRTVRKRLSTVHKKRKQAKQTVH
jgi:hypothetical protein